MCVKIDGREIKTVIDGGLGPPAVWIFCEENGGLGGWPAGIGHVKFIVGKRGFICSITASLSLSL